MTVVTRPFVFRFYTGKSITAKREVPSTDMQAVADCVAKAIEWAAAKPARGATVYGPGYKTVPCSDALVQKLLAKPAAKIAHPPVGGGPEAVDMQSFRDQEEYDDWVRANMDSIPPWV